MRDMFQLHAVHFGVMSAFWLRRARINKKKKKIVKDWSVEQFYWWSYKTSIQQPVSTFCQLKGEIPNWNVAVLWQLDDASSNVFHFTLFIVGNAIQLYQMKTNCHVRSNSWVKLMATVDVVDEVDDDDCATLMMMANVVHTFKWIILITGIDWNVFLVLVYFFSLSFVYLVALVWLKWSPTADRVHTHILIMDVLRNKCEKIETQQMNAMEIVCKYSTFCETHIGLQISENCRRSA